MIFRNSKGQVTGQLLDDKVYEQRLNRRKHSFHSRGELAVDSQHLKSLTHLGCVKVRKIFEDTGETFEAGMEAFKEHGYERQWTESDGVQTFLNEKYWHYENENQMKMF